MFLIDGKAISAEIKDRLRSAVAEFPEKYGRVPQLCVIRVGEDPASVIYVRNKEKACEAVGIKNNTVVLPDTTEEEELLGLIGKLNADEEVDGILVQLPLPKHIREEKVIEAISREKDVDGFHPLNVAGLWQKTPHVSPCTPKGIMKLLESAGVNPAGKRAVVIGRSKIIAELNGESCISKTENIADITRSADIIVAAAGKAGLLDGDMVSPGTVIIDVGMNRDPETGKLCGDVVFDSVAPKAGAITPVPGGVGPMTIACLLENTVECFINRQKRI